MLFYRSPNVTSTGVCMGAHTIRGKEWNWNNDPNFLSTSLGLTTPEKCMRLKKDTLTTAYVNCRSDYTGVLGAVCYKYVPGFVLLIRNTLNRIILIQEFPYQTCFKRNVIISLFKCFSMFRLHVYCLNTFC